MKKAYIVVIWTAVIALNFAALSPFITDKNYFMPTTLFFQFSQKPDAPILSIFCLLVTIWLTSNYVNRVGLQIASVVLIILFVVGLLFLSVAFGIVISILATYAINRLKTEFSNELVKQT